MKLGLLMLTPFLSLCVFAATLLAWEYPAHAVIAVYTVVIAVMAAYGLLKISDAIAERMKA